jgi:hypothetical protein
LLQFGEAQAGGEPTVVAFAELAIDEQPEAFQEAQALDLRQGLVFLQRLQHAGELERAQLVEGGV